MSVKSASDLVKEARQHVENLTPEQVHAELSSGNATLVDLRESEELKQNGKIPQAVHAPPGHAGVLCRPLAALP